MKTPVLAALAAALLGAQTAAAQVPAPPKTWISASGAMYTSTSPVIDPTSNSRWIFDDNGFGVGAALQREFGQGLIIGVEGTWAKTKYQRTDLETQQTTPQGDAAIATAMVSGRFAYGGGGPVGIYLTGGAGAISYNLDDLDGWNSDFALRAGTGIEYMMRRNLGLALEWNRIWGYHEKEDLQAGRQNHNLLRLTARYGL